MNDFTTQLNEAVTLKNFLKNEGLQLIAHCEETDKKH
jgi:16S rRNA (uracil1498-N3)-methyltransferase